jgi:hypothetical protein
MMDPAQLRHCTPSNALRLKDLIVALRREARASGDRSAANLLKSKVLIAQAGLIETSELDIARLGTADKRCLSRADHERLVDHLWKRGFLDGSRDILNTVRESPDKIFHAFALWLGADKAQLADLGERIAGVYRFWRPWTIGSRFVNVGMLVVHHDPARQVITATKHLQLSGGSGHRARSVALSGYLVGDRRWASALLVNPSDDAVSYLSLTGTLASGRYVSLSGVVSGHAEGEQFVAPFYAEWTDESPEAVERELDTVPLARMSWLVRERLEQVIKRVSMIPSLSDKRPGLPDADALL